MLEKFQGEKRKQYIILGTAIILGSAGILLLSEMGSPKKEKVKKEVPSVKIVEEKKIEEESFKGVYGKKLREQEEELKRMKAEIEKLKRELELKEKQLAQQKHFPSPAPPPPPPPAPMKRTVPAPPEPPSSPVSSSAPSQTSARSKPPQKEMLSDLIAIDYSEEEKSPSSIPGEEKKKGKTEKKKVKAGDVIPAGSFVRGILLSGLNAPAGGKALSNPLPVLIRVTNLSVLPNRWRADIKGCFIVGAGYGNLSSERAYIRAETLSCVKENGEVIEVKVDGYVSGEDGKVGLAGRVVTKQGQLLARTLMAGFLEGVARAFQQAGTTYAISPQGVVSTVNPNEALKIGIFSGVGEATKKLADFYMKMASQMFPVIEINAGRKVDVIFLKSVKLEGGEE